MKNWLFILLILQAAWCDARVACKYFDCIEAIQQDFAGGAAGSPSGTAYRIQIIACQPSNKLKIDAIWIGEDYFAVTPYNIRNGQTEFKKGDTLMLSVKNYNQNNFNLIEPDSIETKKLAIPKKYKGAALIGFFFVKKRKYLTVEKLQKIGREIRE